MKVLSKREFNDLQLESLFKKSATGTLTEAKLPYCAGKYQKSVIGRELPEPSDKSIKAVFAVAKSDKHGTYYQLRFAV